MTRSGTTGNQRPAAGRRRKGRPASRRDRLPDRLWLYGLHTVEAALANPRRDVRRLVVTRNALARLTSADVQPKVAPEQMSPHEIDRIVGAGAVHQGIAAEVAPLEPLTLDRLAAARLVIVLDQITDPHNVGAILRSALAFAADAVVTTRRYAPAETGVLAKAASGALDAIPLIAVTNLARALGEMGHMGLTRIGLAGDAPAPFESALSGDRLALVFGAEGKGLRQLTRQTCDLLARLAVPGPLTSLNVSNAAAVALYVARRHLGEP